MEGSQKAGDKILHQDAVEEVIDKQIDERGDSGLDVVDQDIVLINDHVVKFQGDVDEDPSTSVGVGWNNDTYTLTCQGVESTNVNFVDPNDPTTTLTISVGFGGCSLSFFKDGLECKLEMIDSPKLIISRSDMLWPQGNGPVLESPDYQYRRIKVANDGTLSTEIVPQ